LEKQSDDGGGDCRDDQEAEETPSFTCFLRKVEQDAPQVAEEVEDQRQERPRVEQDDVAQRRLVDVEQGRDDDEVRLRRDGDELRQALDEPEQGCGRRRHGRAGVPRNASPHGQRRTSGSRSTSSKSAWRKRPRFSENTRKASSIATGA